MAGLRELKKHLSSVQMTGQMAGAMKTASTAKFARLSRSLADFSAYADNQKKILDYVADDDLFKKKD